MAVVAFLFPGSLHAQIRTDGTVGPATTLTGPHFQIPDSLGTIRGQNLFQSFQTFNLSSGQSATFTGPNSIANVFSRVTGGSLSTIDGLLQCTIPNANFFFINPAGVLFGPNAQVDVQGAFAVTTADYIRFADGGRFDARTPANDVLTVANPTAFGFLTPPAGQSLAGVTFNNCTVQVPDGRTLTVAAGAVQVLNDPAIAPGGTAVRARGGTLQVAAVASAGELPVAGLDTASFSALGNITLSGNSLFSTTHSGGGGQFLLRAQDLTLSDNAGIVNNTLDSGSGGASEIDLRGTLSLASGGYISSASTGQANAGSLSLAAQSLNLNNATILGVTAGSGAGGNITINAPTVSLQNGAWISADAQDRGPGGTITINAPTALLQDDSFISADTHGPGSGGTITINAPIVSLQNGAWNSADTHDVGSGGTMVINASMISLQSSSYLSADAYGPGPGGTITVNAPAVSLENGSTLSADTYGPGPGGAVTLNAQAVRVLSGASISSNCRQGAAGNAGDVTIQATDIVLNQGEIAATTSGAGSGGNISITTGQLALNPGGQIASGTFGAGRAGNITIQATDIVLNEGEISATTSGAGKGGDVRIASDTLSLSGPTADAWINTASLGSGPAGSIFITTRELALKAGGVIISDALDAGRAGNITLQATDIVLNQGRISAGTSGTGAGGDVRIASDTLSLTGAGSIDTSSLNSGQAGNIFITTGEMTLDQGALIFAAPLGPSGDGGDIQIAARDLTLQNGSGIGSTSFGGGVAGSIELTVSGRCLLDSGNIHAASFGATQGGAAGDIVVQANDLEIRGSGFISTTTYGNGAGGNVNITAATMLLTDTASVGAGAGAGSSGKGGDIVVNAGTLQISQNSFLEAASSGNGAGGSVSIQAGQLHIDGAQPFGVAGIHSFGALSGRAGSIEIQAGQLSLVNGQIECEANLGDAGNITIQSGSAITLNNSALRVDSISGNAGTITLSAPGSIVLQNSLVGAFAGLNGGNITIEPQILGLVDSSLNANALTGNGGHISITADFFYQLGNWSITAISQNLAAQPGTISISSGVDFANSLSALPIAPLQETSKIREGCARKNPRANSLIVRGKGGVAARPDAFLPLYDLRLEPADEL